MKIAIGILALFIFGYYLTPLLFRAMAKHDYDTMYHGMKNARIAGGLYYEKNDPYVSYTDKYARGQ